MRVALLAPEIPDYCLEHASIASRCGDVLLCAPDAVVGGAVSDGVAPNCEVEPLRWPRQRELANIPFILSLARRIRRWRPDVVHFLNESNLWLNLLAPMLKSVPVVTTVHDIHIHPGDTSSAKIPRIFAKTLVSSSNAIVVHGEGLRQDAIVEFGISAAKTFVMRHPPLFLYADIAKRRKLSKPADGLFRVLFFGRLHAYKGIGILLEAARSLHEKVPHLRLTIAGTGDDISSLIDRSLVHRDLMDRDRGWIRLERRFISRAETAQMFMDADLVVLPYVEASQSGVLMLAMAFGLPVVASNVGEMPHVVESTGMGLLVPPGNAQALADAILRAACDAGLYDRMKQCAERARDTDYSPATLSQDMIGVYNTVRDNFSRSA